MDSAYIDATLKEHGQEIKSNVVSNMRFIFNDNINQTCSEELLDERLKNGILDGTEFRF